MQKIAVCVSGGGTNLQAIIDAVSDGTIHNTEIAVVISNKENAYALERAAAAGIPAKCINPKSFDFRDDFADAMLHTSRRISYRSGCTCRLSGDRACPKMIETYHNTYH